MSHECCRDTVSMNSLPPVTEPGADKDTSFLVPWVEQHWSTPCVSREVSSRTEPQFPIVTSCLQTIYFLVAYLLVYLFQFFASFTVVPIIISQTNNLDKSLTQGLFPGKFNLIHIIKIFFLLHSFEIHIIMTTQYSIEGYMIYFTNIPLLCITLFSHFNIKNIARMNKWISLCKKV